MNLSVNSIKNQYQTNDYLKTVRNLQSLGVAPTGNDAHDRQNLQVSEYQKKKDTLSGSNAASLGNSQYNFQNTIQQIQGVNSTNGVNGVQGIDSSNAVSGLSASSIIQPTQSTDTSNQTRLAEQQVGATQLGELNKLKLGLIA